MNYFSAFGKSNKRITTSSSRSSQTKVEVKLTNFMATDGPAITNEFDSDNLKSRTLDDKRCITSGIKRFYSAPNSSDTYWAQTKRKAIFVQMYDTEKSYVEALKSLVNKYYLQLKERHLVEQNMVNDIFYKIPEIHVHHELLLSLLKTKLDLWDAKQTIGDILLNIFGKQSVIETYISFVNNYNLSQESLQQCKDSSTLFGKFLEQQAREHRGKLSLKDLLIQPVQRIPRYELYIKDFLKCTSITHPDYQYLLKAQKELHNLAERIDQFTKENSHDLYDTKACLQIVQDLIENCDDLVSDTRKFIRHDTISLITPSGYKKDRCIFLFSDLILMTSFKRTSGNLSKRSSTIILNTSFGKQYLENIKYKLTAKYPLENVDISSHTLAHKSTQLERVHLESDLKLVEKIQDMSKQIAMPHTSLDDSLKSLVHDINQQMSDSASENTNQIKLEINNETLLIFELANNEKRFSWEKTFNDVKRKHEETTRRREPSFLNHLSVPKNRSGMKFTCASPRVNLTYEPGHVWICSTDGQMGQVCLMNTTTPEVSLASCNTVSSSRITCILCVPPRERILQKMSSISESDTSSDNVEDAHASNELKYSTMWIGCDDGCLHIFQFTDSTFRTTSKRNRTTKELGSSLLAIAYFNNKVYISLSNCDLVILTRNPSGVWNLDNVQRKKLTQRAIASISLANGKLWCSYSNCILVLNPNTLLVENNFMFDNETSILMCPYDANIWIVGQSTLDLRLYNSFKYSIQLEINIKSTILAALSNLDELIRIHKQSCLKITCVHLCKGNLWLGTSAGLILLLRMNSKTNSFVVLSHGHVGPVRFITSIYKTQSHKTARIFYVITGGEGYQEYKTSNDIPHVVSFNQSISDDHVQDDTTNFTLIWET